MKNEELKLKAIQEAYGEYYIHSDINGWIRFGMYCPTDLGVEEYEEIEELGVWRPKSLSGIENNLGWIRIEEDGSNLPNGNDADDFWICNENGLFDFFSYPEQIERKFRNGTVTHYQPVIKPKPPIY